MADGSAQLKLFLASQPTGWGKTEFIASAVWVLANDPAYRESGLLILVQTLAQVKVLIARMKLRDDQFVVRTGKDNRRLNNLGLAGLCKTKKCKETVHRKAQVLFVTQK